MTATLRNHFLTAIITMTPLIALFNPPVFSNTIEDVPDIGPDARASADPIFHDSVLQGLELILNDQFEESLGLFDRLQQMHPDHPAPYFLRQPSIRAG